MISEAIEDLVSGKSLSLNQSAAVMNEIMSEAATSAQFGAFVTALRLKGETLDEIAGMAQIMREKSLQVHVDDVVVDTCGTGGDGSGTFNISTTAAFVVAGAGVKVAKHGNRAMSGTCGSADILESLGANIDLSPQGVQRCLEEVNFGFMFAQTYHPSMRFAAGARREIGIRTIFNILGPLTNPAQAKFHLLGIADPEMGDKIAQVLGMLGSTHAIVVHGMDGLDEITLSDATRIWEMKDGSVATYMISPEELGFERVTRSMLVARDVAQSKKILLDVLSGQFSPARDVVILNAAAALVASDKVATIRDGIVLATESIDNNNALETLERFKSLSHQVD